MPGPLPKDPSMRTRRNITPTHAVLTIEPGRKRRVPPLPKIVVGETKANLLGEEQAGQPILHEWHPLTRAWWRDVWRSPMSGEYLQADVHGLYRLAFLIDRFWREGGTGLAAEIRLQQQSFGLTPIDRRRLQWEIEKTEEATRRQRRRPATDEPIEDPRKALRVVGSSA